KLQAAAVKGSHFLDEIQTQTGALAAAGRPRQRIESLAQTRQGKAGNRIALIEQLHLPKIALAKGIEANSSTLWSEVQGIVEQIGQRLTQQKALTRYPHAGLQVHLQLQPGRLDARPLGLDQLFDQLQQT